MSCVCTTGLEVKCHRLCREVLTSTNALVLVFTWDLFTRREIQNDIKAFQYKEMFWGNFYLLRFSSYPESEYTLRKVSLNTQTIVLLTMVGFAL